MSQSKSRRWKGHCLLCATQTGSVRGQGKAARTPIAVLRKLGKRRRLTRRHVADI